MGNAGTPQGRLRRALAVGDPLIAVTAAADVQRVMLDDVLRWRSCCFALVTPGVVARLRGPLDGSRWNCHASNLTNWR